MQKKKISKRAKCFAVICNYYNEMGNKRGKGQ